ncbi:Uncharacterized protein ABC855_g79 [[Candida] zeylanoides]
MSNITKDTPQEAASPEAPKGPAPAASAAAPGKAEEDDLDDLDDLLDDFADDVLSKPPGEAASESGASAPVGDAAAAATTPDAIAALIKDLQIDDPDTKKQFEDLVKQFDEAQQKEAPQDFDEVMRDTVERMRKSGKNIDEQIKTDQAAANPEDILTQLLAGMGGAGGAGGDLDMSKLLVDMLEQLSSKEVLYEPIKDLNTKFPEYLAQNESVIAAKDHANYTQQYEVTTQIVAIFEAPGYDDADKAQRDRVNVLLEALQDLGQPPKELVGEAGEIPGLGGLGRSAAGAGDSGVPGIGAAMGPNGLDFSDKDLPKDFEKELEEGCKQT